MCVLLLEIDGNEAIGTCVFGFLAGDGEAATMSPTVVALRRDGGLAAGAGAA